MIMKRKKGFTLVELLVVIAIIALLMGILMPALARVRRLAHRLICGTNLAGMGKSMMMYAHDNRDMFPRSGRTHDTTWSGQVNISNWTAATREDAFSDETTITADFYLLIKYADASPGLFVCNADDAIEFTLSEADSLPTQIRDIIDPWDFGARNETERMPGEYVSYSYHMGHAFAGRPRPATSTHSGSFAVAADRNPVLDNNARSEYIRAGGTSRDPQQWDDVRWTNNRFHDPDGLWNSSAHQREGQNVLYADTHVEFRRDPLAGVNDNNIWKAWGDRTNPPTTAEQRAIIDSGHGPWPTLGGVDIGPGYRDDSVLVNTPQRPQELQN